MKAAEIRARFLSFFEERDHLKVPSASLVPPPEDRSVLLTTAGMQQFQPYFRGEQEPPHPRVTSCQKVFRTPDIEEVGTTARHLTFFEMLGNFSFGDYFKQKAAEYAWELSTEGFGLDPERIWVTVFGGDPDLGLGPDDEAIEVWKSIGVPDERIVQLGREDNFWQAGPTGPCGPCSELYYDRGPDFGGEDERPGDDTERYLEYWNLVFMQLLLHDDGTLTPLPDKNIDTGLGLERMASILQDVPSVYETDIFRPLVELGEERSGRRYDGGDFPVQRALRILADHSRGMTFLLSDGVVPSNEDRGYVLRRIMRRAIQQGRVLGLEDSVLPPFCERVIELMRDAYPDLEEQRDTILKWAAAEEESFRRTLAQGERLLSDLVRRAKEQGTSWIDAEDAFRLHDTFGFPYELTKELLAAEGLAVDDQGFEELMERAREVARGGASVRQQTGGAHERVISFARGAGFPSRFVGYESTEADTVLGAVDRSNGQLLAKLAESPFYAEGGGQVSDSGVVETPSGRGHVEGVYRLGDDQAVALSVSEGELVAGEAAHAVVDRDRRLATMANHTATHLLHAALRRLLGTHVRQAGSYVGPDKLRFDFTHGERLSPSEAAAVEELVNEWIVASLPVRAVETTRDEAERLGAMALFGEKYGDWVRMVDVEEVSRELCGGTHVASTAEVGLFHLTHETSSAANVRRIEAVTGPEGIKQFRERTEELRELAGMLRVPEREVVPAVRKLTEQLREASKRPSGSDRELAESLVAQAGDVGGVRVVTEVVDAPDQKALLELSDRVKQSLGDAAVVLGTAVDGRVHLIANFTPVAVERGAKAGEVVKAAAAVAGGGGGGRDTMAQAGGRDPSKLPEAIAAARVAIEAALGA
ncbi:MAG: alanyl-tRNA synthetase [Thermoleophilaceae bacterium]|nr:alanyl-tRNA synthetase [Thermoleophilaceae bacterium]